MTQDRPDTEKPHAPIQITDPMELERCRTYSRVEITRLLLSLAKEADLLTAYFNQGKEFILTTVLKVDAEAGRLYLDYGPDEARNRQLLNSDRAVVVGRQRGVRIQFTVTGAKKVALDDGPALAASLPESMIRLQRRNAFRLALSGASPISCQIPLANGQTLEVPVVDLSVGGICIIETAEDGASRWALGDLLSGCRLQLPGHEPFVIDLEIRNRRQVTRPDGRVLLRIGCQFHGIDAGTDATLQRFIHRQELARRRQTRG